MSTLAFVEGLLSPTHILILLFAFGVMAGAIVLIVVVANRASTTGNVTPPLNNPNADLDRRRQELELERMAIENEERRRKLGQP